MQVSEIFYTIQGEGISVGQPAVFLRLSGCHLRCTWCDSKFTWDRKSGRKMEITDIAEKIKEFPCQHLVITGGEPLLQQQHILDLLKLLPDHYVEIETSGSLDTFLNDVVDHYNCSPKLENSGNKTKLKTFPPEKTYFKFVVDSENDLAEIKEFIKKYKIDRKKVLLMPQGIGKREITQRSQWLAEICKSENLRFSPRLHINIWGNKRKV